MSTIRETALACYGGRLPRGTGAKAQEVLDCLVARENDIFTSLVEAGVAFGLTRDQVHLALVEAGMEAPPENFADDQTVYDDRLAALEAKVDKAIAKVEEAMTTGRRLVRWARGRGFRNAA